MLELQFEDVPVVVDPVQAELSDQGSRGDAIAVLPREDLCERGSPACFL